MATPTTRTGLSPAEVRAKHKERSFANVAPYYQEPLVLDRAEGMYIHDADGRKFLDFFGGIPTVRGHRHQGGEAIGDQAKRLGHVDALPGRGHGHPDGAPGDMTPIERKDGGHRCSAQSGTEADETALLRARLLPATRRSQACATDTAARRPA